MRKIKIAQIGIGHDHADVILDSLLAQSDIFEVIGYCVCEGEEEKYQKVCRDSVFEKARMLDVDEILRWPDLDAVVIECCEINLLKYTLLALERNLHIHMDKPGSEDAGEFERAAGIAKRKNRVFHLGYMYRYNPAIQKVRDMIKCGELGQIYSCEAHMGVPYTAEKKRWLGTFRGGMMFFLGCHLVDLLLEFQGIPEEIISFNSSTGFDHVETVDFGMAVFKYKSAASFIKTCASEPGAGSRRQVVVCGEKGTVELKPTETEARQKIGRKGLMTPVSVIRQGETEAIVEEAGPFNRYDTMMSSFAAMVRGEKENPWSYEHEVLLHRMVLKASGFDIDYKKKIIL